MIPGNILKTHVLKAIGIIDRTGVPSNRISNKFDLLYNNTSEIQPNTLSTDNHGTNNVNFAILDFLGYTFAPRYAKMKRVFFDLFEVTEEEGDGLKENLFESFSDIIKDYAFGEYIGEVNAVLDSNLVTIKLEKEGLIKGTDLIVAGRDYFLSKEKSIDMKQNLREYIGDYIVMYNYLLKNPEDIQKIYEKFDNKGFVLIINSLKKSENLLS